MQLFNTIALATLAAFVAADESFTLVANGDGISNSPVTSNGQALGLDNGNTAQIDLQEPSGYAKSGGKFLGITPDQGITLTDDSGAATKDFGFDNGDFRAGPSGSNNGFFACKEGNGYKLQNFQADGCVSIKLTKGGDAPQPSSAAPSSAAPSKSEAPSSKSEAPSSKSEAPSSAAPSEVTETSSSHTLVTVTDCASSVTDCPAHSTASAAPTVATANGAAVVGAGAGAFVAAAAALML